MRLAAIDVGTNSIHAIVVELDPRYGTSRTILKDREMVRLGSGAALRKGELARRSIERGVAAIVRFAQAARKAGATEIRAVATSAVREAANSSEFVDAVYEASGVRIEVLDDLEEARLIHLGVSRGFALSDRGSCIIDIGGGSTEFIVADSVRAHYLRSVRLGSLRMYDRFLRETQSIDAGYRALRKYIRKTLQPVAEHIIEHRFEGLVGTSGTIMGLAMLDAGQSGNVLTRTNGYRLRLEALRSLQRTMLALRPAQRRRMLGMNPRRSDIIVAGNAIVIGAMEALGKDELVVCERALREGIAVDYLERNREVVRRLGDERMKRFDAARELGRRFGVGRAHANQVATLAAELFDRLVTIHHFEPADRDVLFAAGLLHDVGKAIAPSSHHKHGSYIVRHAGLALWTTQEVDLIATLVRYHRTTMPKPTHPEYANADAAKRLRIAGLASLLRLANALDVRSLGVVNGIEIEHIQTGVRIVVNADQDASVELGVAAARTALFSKTFERTLEIVPAPVGSQVPARAAL